MLKGYKFRMYPTTEQESYLKQCIGATRFVYNCLLHDMTEHFEKTGQSLKKSYTEYRLANPWMKDIDSCVLNQAQLNLRKAFIKFGKIQKSGVKFTEKVLKRCDREHRKPRVNEMNGYPKFKHKHDYEQSFTTNIANPKSRTVWVENSRLGLPRMSMPKGKLGLGLGTISLRMHRSIPENAVIRQATVSCKGDKWFVSLTVEYESQVSAVKPERFLGLDYQSKGLYVDSFGYAPGAPRYYRKSQKHLADLQEKLSRCVKRSKNYAKLKLRIAKLHEHIANQRRDWLHKEAVRVLRKADVVCVEDLDLKGMAKKQHHKHDSYGKVVSDNAWGTFVLILGYKLADAGKRLVKCDRYFASSQTCHDCGYKNPLVKDLNVKEWVCPSCGKHHKRDINAALNLVDYARKAVMTA